MITDILPLIPQREPFVMIDTLIGSDETHTWTNFRVLPDNIFVQDGFLLEPALVENIAQTAASRLGRSSQLEGKPAPIGYIGAVQNLEIFALPKVNDVLETEIKVEKQIFDVSVISGKIWCKDELMAQCEMKIFISKS